MAFENGNGNNMYMPVTPMGGYSIDDRIIACMEKMYDEAGSEYERKRIDDVIAHIHNTGM